MSNITVETLETGKKGLQSSPQFIHHLHIPRTDYNKTISHAYYSIRKLKGLENENNLYVLPCHHEVSCRMGMSHVAVTYMCVCMCEMALKSLLRECHEHAMKNRTINMHRPAPTIRLIANESNVTETCSSDMCVCVWACV